MTVRGLSAVAVLLAAALQAQSCLAAGKAPTPAATPARHDLSVMLHDPDQVAAWRSVFLHPFTEATAIPATIGSWSGGLAGLQQALKGPDSAPDLMLVNADELAAGCSGGLFEKLDWSEAGGKDHYSPLAVSDCGVGATVANLVLAWDRAKLAASPSWADFWDVTKFPGKRGLRKGVRGNLEIALIADGVAPGDVYKTLSTPEGLDRAFRKLDQLRPYIVWWDKPADAAKILASGDVLMTSARSPEIVQAGRNLKRDFGIQWSGGLYGVLSFAVPKTAANAGAALQFLYFSGTPAIEGRLVAEYGFGGLAKHANDGLAPAVAALSPTLPANLAGGLRLDAAFWRTNLAKLRRRFDVWLSQPVK